MRNYETKADDIVRCKDCNYNPSIANGLDKYSCPLNGNEYCSETPEDNWFCANGGYVNNLGTTADIVRCKDCINNPAGKGIRKHMICPFDDIVRDDEMIIIDGEEYYYSETVDDTWEDPNGDWFCANGERE